MLTTVNEVGNDHRADLSRKRSRLTSTNDARAWSIFEENAKNCLNSICHWWLQPLCVGYIADQLRSAYTFHFPSLRTCLCLLFFLLDTSVTIALFKPTSIVHWQTISKNSVWSLLESRGYQFLEDGFVRFNTRTEQGVSTARYAGYSGRCLCVLLKLGCFVSPCDIQQRAGR